MTTRSLCRFLSEINVLLDQGESVPIEEAGAHIERGDVVPWMAARFAGRIDLGEWNEAKAARLHGELKRLYDVHGADARRKWGVEQNGLCLLLAWTNELVAQALGSTEWKPE